MVGLSPASVPVSKAIWIKGAEQGAEPDRGPVGPLRVSSALCHEDNGKHAHQAMIESVE